MPRETSVNVSGIQDEDSFTKDMVNREIMNSVQKLSRFSLLDELKIYVKKFKENKDGRVKYSVKAELTTNYGFFYSDHFSWDLFISVKAVLTRLERELIKQKEKESTKPRHRFKNVGAVGKAKSL